MFRVGHPTPWTQSRLSQNNAAASPNHGSVGADRSNYQAALTVFPQAGRRCPALVDRIRVAKGTRSDVEKGDPTVALVTYAMTFFVLGFGDVWGEMLDARHDAKAAGQTPARAIERLRVEAARRLLSESRLPVKRIAQRCGFGSEETLRRSFLRLLAVTPLDYRARFTF